ncbi:uncharacterized protein LOC134180029 [Corticium candelabrum]|uniref:uncharacterized protein LOC134180029 n=1 Tax=Corticium candelabrum TaxID=121492 RepID=UPI002E271435|nr:uncharacterized protein LOC134180029 [Corticium candelabrum]
MSRPKLADAVKKIIDLSKPLYIDGQWKKPRISGRKYARLRKQFVSSGYYWPEKPLRDRSKDVPSKGHKWEREREERLSQIAEKMRKMPQMIADYRQQRKAQKQKSQEKNLKDPTKLLAAIRKKGGTKSQQELEQLLRKHKQKDN